MQPTHPATNLPVGSWGNVESLAVGTAWSVKGNPATTPTSNPPQATQQPTHPATNLTHPTTHHHPPPHMEVSHPELVLQEENNILYTI